MKNDAAIVDGTIIHPPASTKNQSRQPDPEMESPKRGNQLQFGVRCHLGVDADSHLVRTAICSHAKEADITILAALRHGTYSEEIGDRACCSEPGREELAEQDTSPSTPKKAAV
jgi:IS5 family transposase